MVFYNQAQPIHCSRSDLQLSEHRLAKAYAVLTR